MAAARCPDRAGLIDELGTLTWKQLDDRANALASAFQALSGGEPAVIGIMCRNHRGFVSALVAANKIGADTLLLNTSFAGPALADVVRREGRGRRGGRTTNSPIRSTRRWTGAPNAFGSSAGRTSRTLTTRRSRN